MVELKRDFGLCVSEKTWDEALDKILPAQREYTLQDISGSSAEPDLKVIVEPADRSAIVAASGPAQFVPAAQLEQSKQQVNALQSHVEQAVDEYKSGYRCPLEPPRIRFSCPKPLRVSSRALPVPSPILDIGVAKPLS